MAQHTEAKQMYAVVCTRLHTSFGPYRDRPSATQFAERMTAYSQKQAVDNGSTVEEACKYVPITMWINEIVDDEPSVLEYEKKDGRLN